MRILLDTNIILDIVEKRERYFSDFEDAVIAATALREGASYIITRNTIDFVKSPVPAMTPADFLREYNT